MFEQLLTHTYKEEWVEAIAFGMEDDLLTLTVEHRKNGEELKQDVYLYDRTTKRYYQLTDSKWIKDKKIKKRISEDKFHTIFGLYLKQERS